MNLLNMNSIKNDYYVLNSNNNNNFKSNNSTTNESPLAMIKMLNSSSGNKPVSVSLARSSLIITPPPQSQTSSIVFSVNSNNNNNTNSNKLNTNVNKRTNRFQFLNPNTNDINRTSLQINANAPNVYRQSSNHNLHFQHLNLNSNTPVAKASQPPPAYSNNVNIQLKPTKTSTASTTIQKLIKLDDFSQFSTSSSGAKTRPKITTSVEKPPASVGSNYVIKYPKVNVNEANIYDEIESDTEMKNYYSTIFDIIPAGETKTPPRPNRSETVFSNSTNKLHQLSSKINCFKSHQRVNGSANKTSKSGVETTSTTTPYRSTSSYHQPVPQSSFCYSSTAGTNINLNSSGSSSSGLSDISTPDSSYNHHHHHQSSAIDLKNLIKKCTTSSEGSSSSSSATSASSSAANEAYFSLNMINTTKLNPNIIRNARSPVISSGYNSSQESSGHHHHHSTRRLFNDNEFDDEFKRSLDKSLNNLDSGISTLNLLNDGHTSSSGSDVDATSNLSAYLSDNQLSNSPFLSSKSSINSFGPKTVDYDELDGEMQTSPFPKVKTCLIAQVKQINQKTAKPQQPPTAYYYHDSNTEPIYENLGKYTRTHLQSGGKSNGTKQKQYSINDVLHSLKTLESNSHGAEPTSDYEEDLLCDGEVDFYLNQNPQYFNYNYSSYANNHCQYYSHQPARKYQQQQQQKPQQTFNYYNDEGKTKTVKSMAASFMSNNKPIALWEQLV